MNWIKAMIITFSMYSKLPMPRVEWKEKDMKYSLVFFPFIGVIIALGLYGWWWLCDILEFGILIKTAVAVVIPIIITGGIHLDGFLDTVDALSSYQPKEKKLEILKDPHTGAFAIIGCGVYFILYMGVVSEISTFKGWVLMGIGCIISRSLSGLSLVWFHSAKKEGLLYTFSSTAHKKITGTLLGLILLFSTSIIIYVDTFRGIIVIFTAFLVFLYYRYLSYKQFGGITGDLAGFFLQVCELAMAAAVAVTGKF